MHSGSSSGRYDEGGGGRPNSGYYRWSGPSAPPQQTNNGTQPTGYPPQYNNNYGPPSDVNRFYPPPYPQPGSMPAQGPPYYPPPPINPNLSGSFRYPGYPYPPAYPNPPLQGSYGGQVPNPNNPNPNPPYGSYTHSESINYGGGDAHLGTSASLNYQQTHSFQHGSGSHPNPNPNPSNGSYSHSHTMNYGGDGHQVGLLPAASFNYPPPITQTQSFQYPNPNPNPNPNLKPNPNPSNESYMHSNTMSYGGGGGQCDYGQAPNPNPKPNPTPNLTPNPSIGSYTQSNSMSYGGGGAGQGVNLGSFSSASFNYQQTQSFQYGSSHGSSTNPLAIVSVSGKRPLRYVLLHGTLDVTITSARCLPNMDLFSETLRQALLYTVPSAKALLGKAQECVSKSAITSDPYACVILRGATVARTRVISNDQNPIWNEHFFILVSHQVAEVELTIKDNDMVGAQLIGGVKIPAESLLQNSVATGWHDLLDSNGKRSHPNAQMNFTLKFIPVDADPLYKHGVGLGPVYTGVPNTYFPLRRGGKVTLYQDADICESPPDIPLDSGMRYEHRSCWQDICSAILEAQRVIYIAGWSIYTKIKLVRQPNRGLPEAAYKNFGELLKYKSQGNVRILLLVWDDKTSNMFNKQGVMATHDEETKKFFKHSSVRCVLAPRNPDSKHSWVKQQVVGNIYTHHQKLVIVDTKGPGNSRRLTAFVGGLDLCDGRYDTPDHRLFKTLNTAHKDDIYNSAFVPAAEGGPREPWHDLHCRIDGGAAYDVLTNFEQRWKKVTKWKGRLKLDDSLLDFSRTTDILHPDSVTVDKSRPGYGDKYDILRVSEENEPENWHVQVFRSIDSGSVKGFPKGTLEAENMNLVCGKDVTIDTSIHTAYVKAIRSAQHFIYIENQYFLGSSFAWPTYKDAGANHLIPIELALKIASKIKARERFAVYIVIPMWPDGVPTSNAVQEILYWQSQTMEMMYTIIADALREAEMDSTHHPTDYLNFFCLGNRETEQGNEVVPKNQPEKTSTQAQAQRNRRFMVYVHAKGMVVDDEYVILGSANINQRSMDGSRDTEIAMGAYQPHHSWAQKRGHPRGQVYGYRRSLWEEHIGGWENCFMEPSDLECVRSIKKIGDNHWKQYTSDYITEMKGHLLLYPLKVEKNGKVVALPGFECFPDVGGKILGVSTTLPDDLTT